MWHAAEHTETGTGGDAWWHPRSDKLFHDVGVPGNAPGLNPEGDTHFLRPCHCEAGLTSPHEWDPKVCRERHPMTQKEASDTTNWVYLNGKVGFGRWWWEIADNLADELGLDEAEKKYIGNLISRNSLPQDVDVSVGMIRNGKPQIYASSIDRNVVWDSVMSAYQEQHAPGKEQDDDYPFEARLWLGA